MFNINEVEKPMGYHKFQECDIDRQLIALDPVPEGQVWELTSMLAKNNTGRTVEINCAVSDGKEWIALAGGRDLNQYDPVSWSGSVLLGAGWRIGWWFRQAAQKDILQTDATWNVIHTGITPPAGKKKEVKGGD